MLIGDKVRVNDTFFIPEYVGQEGIIVERVIHEDGTFAEESDLDWYVEFEAPRLNGEEFYESELDILAIPATD